MNTLWAKILRNHKIVLDKAVPCGNGSLDDAVEALGEVCRELDIARPIWLRKHEQQFVDFHRTTFRPEDFVEAFPYDQLEIEEFDNDAPPRRAKRDPRIDA